MKTCVLLLALVWGDSAQTPPRSRAQGNCEQGNGRVTTNGVQSATTTRVMRSFPGCTVTIFNAGTVTLSTIFSDDAGTPLANPFTSASDGYWFFFANDGPYDVQLSGAGIASPFTHAAGPLFDPRYLAPGSGAVARTIKSKLNDTISVKDYGAKGDGSTDDTTAIQAAFAAGVALPACVYVPAGTYILSNTVTVSSGPLVHNFCVTGPPGATWTFLGGAGDGIARFQVSGGFSAATVFDFSNTTSASVNNISVKGNTGADCIVFSGSGGWASITGSSFDTCNNAARFTSVGGERVFASQFENSNTGVNLNGSADFVFTDCYVHDNTPGGLYTGNDKVIGDGYYLLSGNGIIKGGKIEFNAKGIVADTTIGQVINDIEFDSNRWCHICTLDFIPQLQITGNRFRAGGSFYNSTLLIGGSAIAVNPHVSFARINITGNSFTRGADGGDTGLNQGPTSIFRVEAASSSDASLQIVGNFGFQGAFTNRFQLNGPSVAVRASYTNRWDDSPVDVLTNGAVIVPFSEPVVNSPSVTTQSFIVQPPSGTAQVQVQQSATGQAANTAYLTKAVPTPAAPDYFTGMFTDGSFQMNAFGVSTNPRFLQYDPSVPSVNIPDVPLKVQSGINLFPTANATCATLPSSGQSFGDMRIVFSCGASSGLCVAGATPAIAIWNSLSGGSWRCIPLP